MKNPLTLGKVAFNTDGENHAGLLQFGIGETATGTLTIASSGGKSSVGFEINFNNVIDTTPIDNSEEAEEDPSDEQDETSS